MPKEISSKERKAINLVARGRVKVTVSDKDRLYGYVRGHHGEYVVEINPEGSWCGCAHGSHHPGRATCSHVLALRVAEIGHSQQVTSR